MDDAVLEESLSEGGRSAIEAVGAAIEAHDLWVEYNRVLSHAGPDEVAYMTFLRTGEEEKTYTDWLSSRGAASLSADDDAVAGSAHCVEGFASGAMAPACDSPVDVLRARKALPEVGLECLLRPGMLYKGRICVPGMQSDNGREYELVILERIKERDDLVIASHAAYDDEQAVTINVRTSNEDGICVNWSDAETVCDGIWDFSKFRFDGHVKQRLQANESGIFHASEVLHTFTLIPQSLNGDMKQASELFCGTTEALVSHRERAYVALQTCLRCITAAFRRIGDLSLQEMLQLHISINRDTRWPLTEKQQLLRSMRHLRWGELLSEYCRVSAERLCALLRLRADQLDLLSFRNPGDREAFKLRWKGERCDLRASHACTDEQNAMIGNISMMAWAWAQVERNSFHHDAVKWRLLISFDCFDAAWKRAEKRLSDEELDVYLISTREFADGEVCTICQSEICSEDSNIYRLRCSHMFHRACLRQWAMSSNTCPFCRAPIKAASEAVLRQLRQKGINASNVIGPFDGCWYAEVDGKVITVVKGDNLKWHHPNKPPACNLLFTLIQGVGVQVTSSSGKSHSFGSTGPDQTFKMEKTEWGALFQRSDTSLDTIISCERINST